MSATPFQEFKTPDYTEIVRNFFEPRLLEIGLGEGQIADQTLPQLRESLDRVNDCIANPQSFGVIKLKMSASGLLVISMSEPHIEVGILPLLLVRKKLILDRMQLLATLERTNSTGSTDIDHSSVVEEAHHEGKELNPVSEIAKWREQAAAADESRRVAQLAQEAELARVELFERRSRVWQKFLERQSVATIVGAILLVSIFVYIAASSASGRTVPELISNAFLVILGYFFGQAKSEASKSDA